MNKTFQIALAAILLAASLFWAFGCSKSQESQEKKEQAPETAPVSANASLAHLYFADAQGARLVAEDRMIADNGDPVRFCRVLLDALLAGPVKNGVRCIPEGTKVLAVFISPDKTAYVDLNRQARDGQPGGSMAEALTVFSIVNTLALNVEQVETVKILIEGQEAGSLAGHVDLRRPFSANKLIIG